MTGNRRGRPEFRQNTAVGWDAALRAALRPYRGQALPSDEVLMRRATSALRQHDEVASARRVRQFVADLHRLHTDA